MEQYPKVAIFGALLSLMVALLAPVGLCGNLDDPAAPTSGSSAMYTIEDIYKLLNGDTSVAKRTGAFTEPASGPSTGTGHTLDDVMDQVKHRAHVRKSGQATSYATGDDGALQKGVSWPSPRFTDNGNGTVTDNLTRLIWLKNANCNGTMSWANALTWANGLFDGCTNCGGTNNDCGLTDGSTAGQWRLPNIEELLSLVDAEFSVPALSNAQGTGKWTEGNAFFGVQSANYSDNYWSSTTYANYTTQAWNVSLYDGHLNTDNLTNSYYAWSVRGGQ